MTSKTNRNPDKQKNGALNTKLLIAAASITLTLGGAIGFLGEQLTTPTSVAVEQADAGGITITYPTPAANSATQIIIASEVTNTPAPTSVPTSEPTIEPAAVAAPTDTPTAVPTIAPTTEPTLEPTATQAVVVAPQQPVFVARSRSSR